MMHTQTCGCEVRLNATLLGCLTEGSSYSWKFCVKSSQALSHCNYSFSESQSTTNCYVCSTLSLPGVNACVKHEAAPRRHSRQSAIKSTY